jgi:SAM-dependent methyltransferase
LVAGGIDIFQCPTCSAGLLLVKGETAVTCSSCTRRFESVDGVVDFVGRRGTEGERSYYDERYRVGLAGSATPLDVGELARTWTGRNAPWEMQRVWERLGNIAGKTVLLLGNGESKAELHMLTRRPRVLVYSDLSPVGLTRISSELGDVENVFFAAIDALDLPVRDSSVDLVYGFAFVHHLPDLDRFLGEVARVLRPGGRAVFMDNGYSPLWQHVKLAWLRPLMWLSHRREPRSPEDVRDTMAGGFREGLLAERIRAVGGEPWFERVAFLYFYWKRASVSLFPEIFRIIPRHDLISRGLKWIDCRLARVPFVRRNMIRLVWGFDRAPAPAEPVA